MHSIPKRNSIAGVLLVLAMSQQLCHAALPIVDPIDVGLDADRLNVIDQIVDQGIKRSKMPGAVVLIGHRGNIVFRRAYGQRQLRPQPVPMTVDTVFDLASLTKPIATATSIMQLVEQGRIRLNDPVAQYLPMFAQNGKENITILQLLTHTGGLIPDNSLKDYLDGTAKAFERISALETYRPPGSAFVYSDVGFLVLAKIVERVSGQSIDTYSHEHLFQPLLMKETGFLPREELQHRAAATQQRDGRWMVGEVHDPRSYALGGVAGHAGLFSTASDLARYAQMMLNGGTLDGRRVLKSDTVRLMTRSYAVPGGRRGLGWDIRTGYSSNRGDLMSDRAFGHGGFTGTAIWIDPELELFVVFLSNRVHPDGKGSVNAIAGRVGTIAAAAIATNSAPANSLADVSSEANRPPVSTGIDVLVQTDFEALRGRRVGLITNHTGIDSKGVSTVRRFKEATDIDLVALFSPEHGFAGQLDVAVVGDSKDPETGLKVISLYGKSRQPSAQQLAGIDTLVFDIQDIGTRFYTYISTMGLAMEAAAREEKSFVILDRPNPIGGIRVEGPVLDAGDESFVGFHPICVRHGMTVGELGEMIRAEREWKLDLKVIRCRNWNRNQWYDDTGLEWRNPSPNMRNLTQAVLYPGIGLLETTNLSVGRGTDTPFEVVGAPWIDATQLAQQFNSANLVGVRAIPIRFTPRSSKFAGEQCQGLNFLVTDRNRLRPFEAGITLGCLLRSNYPKQWDTRNLNRLLSDTQVQAAMLEGNEPSTIFPLYNNERSQFLNRRSRFLIY